MIFVGSSLFCTLVEVNACLQNSRSFVDRIWHTFCTPNLAIIKDKLIDSFVSHRFSDGKRSVSFAIPFELCLDNSEQYKESHYKLRNYIAESLKNPIKNV